MESKPVAKEKLNRLKKKHAATIKEIRGLGIMAGIELNIEGSAIVAKCMENALLINCTQKNILRVMPPLVVKKGQVSRAIKILHQVLTQIERQK